MKKTLFSALVFAVFTACAPRPQMSASINAEKVVTEPVPYMTIKHKVRSVDGRVPQTKIVNLSLQDSVTISEKVHIAGLETGNFFKIETTLEGYVSKVYFVDTQDLAWDETLTVVITPLARGTGSDTLGVIMPGDGVQPVQFNNQPAMPVVFHPGNSISVVERQ